MALFGMANQGDGMVRFGMVECREGVALLRDAKVKPRNVEFSLTMARRIDVMQRRGRAQ